MSDQISTVIEAMSIATPARGFYSFHPLRRPGPKLGPMATSIPFRARFQSAVRTLSPGYFALVMASGIVSVGLHLQGFDLLSDILLIVCASAYVVLFALTVWRFVHFRSDLADDFKDPSRAFGFLTFIAGTNVLGVRLAIADMTTLTAILLTIATATWLVLGYVIPWTAVLGRTARPVVASANGTWFIWVVASQSVAVAAASLEPFTNRAAHALGTLAVVSWSVGVFLYAAAGVIVALRMLLYELKPTDLNPPYWVAMGACAITVLAGARILEMSETPMVHATRGLVAGASVMFWAFATWLIPVLIAAGWWRHKVHRVPLKYEATLWSIMFPLGMYAVAGIYLGQANQLPLVGAIGSAWLWIALAAWLATFITMAGHVQRTVFSKPRQVNR